MFKGKETFKGKIINVLKDKNNNHLYHSSFCPVILYDLVKVNGSVPV